MKFVLVRLAFNLYGFEVACTSINSFGRCLHTSLIYYSKFDKGQTFNFVYNGSCLSDTKNVMIGM